MVIPPGASATLADLAGPAQITHLWLTQLDHYRECLLKLTYDDAPFPSLLVPLGDFFCLGHGLVNSFQSALFSASTHFPYLPNKPCALNCYARIPFARRARLELVNQSDQPHRQYFYVDYESLEDFPPDTAYFHADFRRANPFRGWAPEITVNTPQADVPNLERRLAVHPSGTPASSSGSQARTADPAMPTAPPSFRTVPARTGSRVTYPLPMQEGPLISTCGYPPAVSTRW